MLNAPVQQYSKTKSYEAEQTHDLLHPVYIKNMSASWFRAKIIVLYVPVFQNKPVYRDSTNEWTNEDRKSEKLIHKVDKVKWSDYDEYDDRSFGAMTLAQIRTACCTFLLEIVYKPDNAWGFVEERQKIEKSLRSQNLEFWILSPAFKVLDFQCDHMLE